MLIELILALVVGVTIGIFTGLMPGIHINLIGSMLIGVIPTSPFFLSINSLYFVVFIVAMAITHTFIDFIPSIFLGCPDTDTELSILPGHKLLKEGKGYEAVMLTAYGGLGAIFLFLIMFFPLIIIVERIYDFLRIIIPYLLIIVLILLIFSEKNKFTAFSVFVLTGLLGTIIFELDLKEPLLPLLTGLFGSSMLILSIKNKIQISRQNKIYEKITNLKKPLLGALIASPLCGFLPGLGSGQAAVIGNSIIKTDTKGFLVLLGGTNALVMGFSFIALYTISKTRTGAAAAIESLVGIPNIQILVMIIITIALAGILSFFLVKILAKFFIEKLVKVNYTTLAFCTLILLTLIVLIFSNFLGFIIFIIATLTGIYCIQLSVRKTNMMGCLLLPTIIFYLF